MRLAALLITSCVAVAFANSAWAAPVTVAPVALSAEFETKLDERLGAREGDELRAVVSLAVARACHGASVESAAPITVETTIVDAAPNRPTWRQLAERPGLDYFRSISIGGAQLHAVLRGSDGRVLGEVEHRRYNSSFADLTGAESTWTEARSSIRRFAEKVADAYVAASQ